ncbi:Serine/threonine-protein kinase 17A [Frankliniella fusca]|uniref:Serine/threonine-protein kinase 17A n=1 Tax=Frankliniella fusca TaxID=407009 RepID=A0AAE1LPZ6_9NEOP|nr:Serine/threonine-protein kinase 17A [Frankliniella fusca]
MFLNFLSCEVYKNFRVPQNLVLTGDFPDCDVKLCDFGISRYLGEGADVREILGTPDYVAPEVLNYEPISLATDMWSVGVLLYVLLTGCSPFGGETKQETFCNISQCRLDFPDDLFEDVSDNAKDLMRKLIVKDPKRRLSASECLRHHWFAAQESVAASPSPVVTRRHSVAAPPCAPPCASPKQPPPLPATPPPASEAASSSSSPPASPPASPRRAAPVDSQGPDSRRPLPGLDRSQSAHAVLSGPRRLAAADSLDSLDRLPGAQSTPRTGISAQRRNTFLRNMESIAKRLSVAGDAEADADADTGTEADPAPGRAEEAGGQLRARASVRASARAMQTMPVRRAFEVTSLGHAAAAGQRAPASGLTSLAGLATSAVDLRSDMTAKEKEVVFKFRKVFVLEDEDLDALSHLPVSSMSPPPSINGSTGSSVYSDTSISDSNSDTVSELSVDSSSDRSSIISLDHDDQYPWDMAYARLGPLGLSPLGRLYHPGYNVWERTRPQQAPGAGAGPGGSARLYPRECKGSFARALSRFATEDKAEDRARTAGTGSAPGPGPSGGCGGGGGRPILNKLALMQTAMNRGKRCGLELMREKNGNLVVIREIREVKPGGRYARFSEVKCESVQSRIRKLQVQGAKS